MKVKRYDDLFLHWFGYIFAVLAVISVDVVRADALPPPQTVQQAIALTPTNKSFTINTHNNTGTYTKGGFTYSFNIPKPNSNQFGNLSPLSDPLKGGKSLNVVIKDPYGNAARKTINTQTQLPANSTLNKVATGYMAGAIAGNVVNSSHAEQAAVNLAQGNYGRAAAHAAASFDFFGIGSGLYNMFNGYQNAKAAIANPVQQAAEEKAQRAAAMYEPVSPSKKNELVAQAQMNGGYLYRIYLEVDGIRKDLNVFVDSSFGGSAAAFVAQGDGSLNKGELYGIVGDPVLRSYLYGTGAQQVVAAGTEKMSIEDILNLPVGLQSSYEPTLEDFLLNQAEIQSVIANALTQMLNNQQENTVAIKDLVNMLWANNQLNPSNTQTTVTGSTADNTFLTAPYTPQGSNQAQQTQFIINPDGTISTSFIPRPDLAPNTAQAPTRQIVNNSSSQTTQNQQDNEPNNQKDNPEQPDICKQNPNSLMCAEMKEMDYENVELPNEQLNLDFQPADLFVENGVCPAPKQIEFYGKIYALSYQPICDFATGARPMMILLGIVIAMSMVYATVKEM